MLITHTRDAAGHRRIYLGGKGSVECWLEPDTGNGWTFHMDADHADRPLSMDDRRTWQEHILTNLSALLDIPADQLSAVSFDTIAALHQVNQPNVGRATAPRRRSQQLGFVASPPSGEYQVLPLAELRAPRQATIRKS